MRAILVIMLLGSLGFSACTNAGKDQAQTKTTAKKQYKYICIMHPGTGSDKPGVCSKCGMQLVERDTTDK